MLLTIFLSFFNFATCDYAIRGQFGFQDAATSIMQGIINLHHHIFFFIIIVLIFVFYIMFRTYKVSIWEFNDDFFSSNKSLSAYESLINKNFIKQPNLLIKLKLYSNLNVNHGTALEIIWTIIPSLILLCIVGPSFALLFAMDASSDPDFSIKVIGHQWYWSYEYSDTYYLLNEFNPISTDSQDFDIFFKIYYNSFNIQQYLTYMFDSYMKATPELVSGELRLLEVDNALYLPAFTKLRLDITSDDVMHAFAVPSLGIKIDAIPGRLNVIYLDILREGIFFGQCSELCGVNHGYMPIKIIVVDLRDFIQVLLFGSFDSMLIKGSNGDFNDLFNLAVSYNNIEFFYKIY